MDMLLFLSLRKAKLRNKVVSEITRYVRHGEETKRTESLVKQSEKIVWRKLLCLVLQLNFTLFCDKELKISPRATDGFKAQVNVILSSHEELRSSTARLWRLASWKIDLVRSSAERPNLNIKRRPLFMSVLWRQREFFARFHFRYRRIVLGLWLLGGETFFFLQREDAAGSTIDSPFRRFSENNTIVCCEKEYRWRQ